MRAAAAHATVGNAAHVVKWSCWLEPEASIEPLGRGLGCQDHLGDAVGIGGSEEEAHEFAPDASTADIGQSGNPGDERGNSRERIRGEPPCRCRPPPRSVFVGRSNPGQGDQAARVVRVRDEEIGSPLFFGEDAAANLEHGELIGWINGLHDIDKRRP